MSQDASYGGPDQRGLPASSEQAYPLPAVDAPATANPPAGRDRPNGLHEQAAGDETAIMVEPAEPAGEAEGFADQPIPLRMINEYAYCPRLFHLMHIEGRWADNVYTIDGQNVHRRVDQLDHVLPDADRASPSDEDDDEAGAGRKGRKAKAEPEGDPPPDIARSVPLTSDILGVTAKLDLVATAPDPDGEPAAVPVETKRGRVPDNAERSWEPERIQLMAQGMLLREHGYRCDHGVLYFAGSRTRVDVHFTQELEARTLEVIAQAHAACANAVLPPPLEDSPKCRGCSLSGICMPDETLALQQAPADPDHPVPEDGRPIRRLYPAREDAQPFYVQEPGASVGKTQNRLVVKKSGEKLGEVRIRDISQLVLCGPVSISTQAVQTLCEADVPIVYLSTGHWFYGVTHGQGLRNAFDRAAQFQAAGDPARCLQFAVKLVLDKTANQRTLLRRNAEKPPELHAALRDLDDLRKPIVNAGSLASLLGLEGAAAAIYFKHFARMLRPRDFDAQWDFTKRNRRPPRDPVNAMLSFTYSMLAREFTLALISEGLDPWWGLYHQPRHGRPALALDLMEPFRPLLADSAVLAAINTGMLRQADFITSSAGCVLHAPGRKALIRAWEARLDQLITHPVFDYRCSWRSVIKLQARLFARWLRRDIPEFTSIVTR